MQTTHKVFPDHKYLQLRENQRVFVKLEYLSLHLRCSFCFSYTHASAICPTIRELHNYNIVAAQGSTSRPNIEPAGRTSHGAVPPYVFQQHQEPLLPLPKKKLRLDHDVLECLNADKWKIPEDRIPLAHRSQFAKPPAKPSVSLDGEKELVVNLSETHNIVNAPEKQAQPGSTIPPTNTEKEPLGKNKITPVVESKARSSA